MSIFSDDEQFEVEKVSRKVAKENEEWFKTLNLSSATESDIDFEYYLRGDFKND